MLKFKTTNSVQKPVDGTTLFNNARSFGKTTMLAGRGCPIGSEAAAGRQVRYHTIKGLSLATAIYSAATLQNWAAGHNLQCRYDAIEPCWDLGTQGRGMPGTIWY